MAKKNRVKVWTTPEARKALKIQAARDGTTMEKALEKMLKKTNKMMEDEDDDFNW